MDKLLEQINSLISKIDFASRTMNFDNILRRRLFSELELLRLDVEELLSTEKKDANVQAYTHTFRLIDKSAESLKLVSIEPIYTVLYWIDVIFRFFGVSAGIITLGNNFVSSVIPDFFYLCVCISNII